MCNISPAMKDELTAFKLHGTRLAVHGKVFQIHWTGKYKRQPRKERPQHHNDTVMVCKMNTITHDYTKKVDTQLTSAPAIFCSGVTQTFFAHSPLH